MDFFGLGFGEILLIVVIALIILGPEKVPELARTLGRTMRTFRQAASGFTTTITKELDEARKTASDLATDVTQELDEARKTTSDLATAVTKELDEARKTTSDLTTAVTKELDEARKSLAPPSSAGSPDSSVQESANVSAAEPGNAEVASPRDQRDLNGKNG